MIEKPQEGQPVPGYTLEELREMQAKILMKTEEELKAWSQPLERTEPPPSFHGVNLFFAIVYVLWVIVFLMPKFTNVLPNQLICVALCLITLSSGGYYGFHLASRRKNKVIKELRSDIDWCWEYIRDLEAQLPDDDEAEFECIANEEEAAQ